MRSGVGGVALGAGLALIASMTGAGAEGVAIDAGLGLETRYVFRGIELAGASLQPAISIERSGIGPGSLYAGAWMNFPVDGEGASATPGGKEIDLSAGYSAEVHKFLTIDAGVTYYAYPDFDAGPFDVYREDAGGDGVNTVEFYLGLAVEPVGAKVYLYRDLMLDTVTLQGVAAHAFPLAHRACLELAGAIGHVFDDDPGGSYLYGHASANVAYALSERTAAYGGVRYGGSDIPGGRILGDRALGQTKSSALWFGFGINANF